MILARILGPRRFLSAVLALGALWPGPAATAAAQSGNAEMERKHATEIGLGPGMILEQSSVHLAADLLPPEIVKHYQANEFRNEVAEWPLGRGTLGSEFAALSEQNAQTLTVDEIGTIVDKTTGKQPAYISGTPFPKVDPSDPQGGVKVIWNYFYTAAWWAGSSRAQAELLWLSAKGVDRQASQEVVFKYYEGVSPDFRPPANPNNLVAQFLAKTTKPADLYGTVALSWRYRDPHKRDSLWAYVPALRRVRAVSPANRSDGFLGSDMSQDDGQFFDGKPEDFTWKLVGERDALRFVDPYRLTGDVTVIPLPGGGWRGVMKPTPAYGFEDKSWKGLAWAPVADKLARRRVWVIEAVPKDKYYLYGKLELLVDQETWQGVYSRKFGWSGELLSYMKTGGGPPVAMPDGVHFCNVGVGNGQSSQFVENIKMNRATAVAMESNPQTANDRFIQVDASLFDYQTLSRLGK